MRILFICSSLPYPPNGGGEIRLFNLIKRLSQRHAIEAIAIDHGSVRSDDIDQLKKYCSNVYVAPSDKRPKLLRWIRVGARLFKGEPFLTKYVVSSDLETVINRVTRDRVYDVVHFENSNMARNLRFLHAHQKAKTILSMQNITSIQFYRMFTAEKMLRKKIKYFLTWFPMLSWEPMIAKKFDKIVTVSEVDKIILQALQPGLDISVVPNGIDTTVCHSSITGKLREKNILIVGAMDYEPNVDAVMYFYEEIFPVIRKKMPECTLTIVGRNAPLDIQRLRSDRQVIVEANVKELAPYYERALVSAVALRSGGGTRLKILESMAFGTPVVSTSIGCEGLEVKNGHDILVADNPTDFANSVLEIMTSPALWGTISAKARKLVEERYDWDQISISLEHIYDELVRV